MGGLAPSSQGAGLCCPPLSLAVFSDFREHRPRMRIDDLDALYGKFVARAPTSVFPRGFSQTLALGIHAVCDFTDSVLAEPAVTPTAPSGTGKKIFPPAPAPPLAPATLACVGRSTICPAPAQPSLHLSTAALEIFSFAPVFESGWVGVGTDNVSSTTSNPEPFFYSDAGDLDSQASPAQLQAGSQKAMVNHAPSLVVPPAPPQLPSTPQAHPPILVPSEYISKIKCRRQAAAAGSPKPTINYVFDPPAPVSPPGAKPLAAARCPSRP